MRSADVQWWRVGGSLQVCNSSAGHCGPAKLRVKVLKVPLVSGPGFSYASVCKATTFPMCAANGCLLFGFFYLQGVLI